MKFHQKQHFHGQISYKVLNLNRYKIKMTIASSFKLQSVRMGFRVSKPSPFERQMPTGYKQNLLESNWPLRFEIMRYFLKKSPSRKLQSRPNIMTIHTLYTPPQRLGSREALGEGENLLHRKRESAKYLSIKPLRRRELSSSKDDTVVFPKG